MKLVKKNEKPRLAAYNFYDFAVDGKTDLWHELKELKELFKENDLLATGVESDEVFFVIVSCQKKVLIFKTYYPKENHNLSFKTIATQLQDWCGNTICEAIVKQINYLPSQLEFVVEM